MIQKTKTIVARRIGNVLHWNGDENLASDTKDMLDSGLRVPDGDYRVTYKLDPKGPLLVFIPGSPDLPAIRLADGPPYVWAHVCFLYGLGWENKRVSRTIRRLP